jgi:hypothetical protein
MSRKVLRRVAMWFCGLIAVGWPALIFTLFPEQGSCVFILGKALFWDDPNVVGTTVVVQVLAVWLFCSLAFGATDGG